MSKEAMKLALEALEISPMSRKNKDAIDTLREALAKQPAQQEPGRNHWEDGDVFERIGAMKKQPAQQEPVALQWLAEMILSDCGCSNTNQRLLERVMNRIQQYERANTSPPQRKPLTREQVKGLCESAGYDMATSQERADFINGIRHAEAAHNIKENT